MKSAIFISDGDAQIVFTAESDGDRAALVILEQRAKDSERHAVAMRASFYEANGGWMRVRPASDSPAHSYYGTKNDDSLIIRFVPEKPE